MLIGYDASENKYYIDRSHSGIVSFEKGFAQKSTAKRLEKSKGVNLTLVVDRSSVELFADDGLTVMTSIFFPTAPFTSIKINSEGLKISQLTLQELDL